MQLAEQIAVVALPLAAVLLLGVGATETALLQLAQTLPFLLVALWLRFWERTRPSLSRPIGAGIGALVAASAGMHWCLIASTVSFLAQCAIVFRSQLPRVRELPATSENSYAVR